MEQPSTHTHQRSSLHGGRDVALGHTHEFSGIKRVGKTAYAYSGTHEGHGFDECGPKGVICGTVSKGSCSLGMVETCIRQYAEKDIDVSDARTIEDIIALVKKEISDSEYIYRFALRGTLADSIVPDIDVICSCIDAFYLEIADKTVRDYNLEELAKRQNLKGFVARTVLEELKKSADEDVDIVCSASDYLYELLDNGGGR